MNKRLIDFTPRGDERGWLIALEANCQVPFPIQRVYYVYDTLSGVRRGKHAHKLLRQVAVCLHGSCRFLMDDGDTKEEIVLDRLDFGLLIEPMVWHEMDEFSKDCVLLVLASAPYDENDYIRSYPEFIARAKATR